MKTWIVIGLLTLAPMLSACTPPPPNLSPVAQTAFKSTQAIKALDMIRDTAIAAHETTPPLLTEQATGTVVSWHRSTIIVVNSAQSGWEAVTLAALDQLADRLSGSDRAALVPYITLARTIIAEVQK